MNESNQDLGETASIELANELRKITRLLWILISLLAANVCGTLGMEVEELMVPAFLVIMIYLVSKIVSRAVDYLTERENWKKQSEIPINNDKAPNPSDPVR